MGKKSDLALKLEKGEFFLHKEKGFEIKASYTPYQQIMIMIRGHHPTYHNDWKAALNFIRKFKRYQLSNEINQTVNNFIALEKQADEFINQIALYVVQTCGDQRKGLSKG